MRLGFWPLFDPSFLGIAYTNLYTVSNHRKGLPPKYLGHLIPDE
jgi:hypothetical protein